MSDDERTENIRNESDSSKMITLPIFLDLLNGDQEREYAAAVQYIAHAAGLTGPHFVFVGELQAHADEEIGHAKKLADHINFIGGIVSVKVGPTFSASESLGMIRQDLDGEKEAIARYTERIAQANELGLPATAQLLAEILIEEVSHANDLQSILNIKGGAYAY
jgi:bacterioferritin